MSNENVRAIVKDVLLDFSAQAAWIDNADPAFLTSLDVFAKRHLKELSKPETFRTGVIIGAVYEQWREKQRCQAYHLTPRQTQVLNLVVQGYSNLEISQALSISIQTAKNHVARIYPKLGVKSRVQAVSLVLKARSAPVE